MEFSGSWNLNPIRIPWKCHKGLEGCSSDEFAADFCDVTMILFLPSYLKWKMDEHGDSERRVFSKKLGNCFSTEQGDLLRKNMDQGEHRKKKNLPTTKNNLPSQVSSDQLTLFQWEFEGPQIYNWEWCGNSMGSLPQGGPTVVVPGITLDWLFAAYKGLYYPTTQLCGLYNRRF